MEEFKPETNLEDAEKEELKQKIRQIIEFPVFTINTDPAPDPKKLAENPKWVPGAVEHLSPSLLAQLVLVVIEEQPALNFTCYFENEGDENEFISLLNNAGVETEITEEAESHGYKVAVMIGAKLRENIEKMKEVQSLRRTDRKEFDIEYGKLMGFPETAIQAFVGNAERLTEKNVEEEKEKYPQYFKNQPKFFAPFIYSKDHADEEHAFRLRRSEKLREYAPQLFEE